MLIKCILPMHANIPDVIIHATDRFVAHQTEAAVYYTRPQHHVGEERGRMCIANLR